MDSFSLGRELTAYKEDKNNLPTHESTSDNSDHAPEGGTSRITHALAPKAWPSWDLRDRSDLRGAVSRYVSGSDGGKQWLAILFDDDATGNDRQWSK